MKKVIFLLLSAFLIFSCAKEEIETKDQEKAELETVLEDKLNSMKEKFLANADQEKINDYELGIDLLEESGILDSAVNVNSIAPNFKLPSAKGDSIELYTLLQNGPVVLVWYRGGWCPYCNIQLQAYTNYMDELKEMGATLVAISPEIPDSSLTTAEKNNLDFIVLSDVDNQVAKKFRIAYELPEPVKKHFSKSDFMQNYNGNNNWTLPLAVTYIIDTDWVVKFAYLDPDYRRRAEPALVIEFLKEIEESK